MIALTRLNGKPVMVNADLIESIEPTPDTVITLTSGNKLIVRDTPEEIQAKIVDYQRRVQGPKEG
jgi:flagellar protein FlbD